MVIVFPLVLSKVFDIENDYRLIGYGLIAFVAEILFILASSRLFSFFDYLNSSLNFSLFWSSFIAFDKYAKLTDYDDEYIKASLVVLFVSVAAINALELLKISSFSQKRPIVFVELLLFIFADVSVFTLFIRRTYLPSFSATGKEHEIDSLDAGCCLFAIFCSFRVGSRIMILIKSAENPKCLDEFESKSYLTYDGIPPSEEDRASFLSKYSFSWVFQTLMKSKYNLDRLNEEDLPRLPETDNVDLLNTKLEKWLKKNVSIVSKPSDHQVSFFFTLVFLIQKETFISSFFHGLLFQACMLTDPIILKELLTRAKHMEQGDNLTVAIFLILLLSLSMFIRVSCMEICYFHSTRCMNNARSAIIPSIFRRSLGTTANKSNYDHGKLVNLMASDADKIGNSSWIVFFLAQWFWALVTFPLILYFLHDVVGNAAFIGTLCIFFGSWAMKRLNNRTVTVNMQVLHLRDQRATLLKAFLDSARVTKVQNWEDLWMERIKDLRQRELEKIAESRYINVSNSFLGAIISLMVPVSIFSYFTIVDDRVLDSSVAFTALAWISQMNWSISTLPQILQLYANLFPSCSRILQFFCDTAKFDTNHNVENPSIGNYQPPDDPKILEYQNDSNILFKCQKANIHRFGGTPEPVLQNVSVEIKRGSLMIIAGSVGSGKSTLLSSMADANFSCHFESATPVYRSGTRAYAKQSPFLISGTIKDNILFRLPFDKARYDDAVARTALEADFNSLLRGDETVVGPKGVQLSGGQKARIALARAIYANCDAYYFDDILSAVDEKTRNHLWNECVLYLTKQRNQAVVLVTHQLQYISSPDIDELVFLKNGTVYFQGKWNSATSGSSNDSLLSLASEFAQNLFAKVGLAGDAEKKQVKNEDTVISVEKREIDSRMENKVALKECLAYLDTLLTRYDGYTIDWQLKSLISKEFIGEIQNEDSERRNMNEISWRDFKVYLSAFGNGKTIAPVLIIIFIILNLGTDLASTIWLSIWSNAEDSKPYYLEVYVSLGVASATFASIETLFLIYFALMASMILHNDMLKSVLYAPLSFFDSTPVGRIMNRFLHDIMKTDSGVPDVVASQIERGISILLKLCVVCVYAPVVLITVPILLIPYTFIFKTARSPARDSRRIEAIAHSPVFDQYADILDGKETLRAYEAEKRFEEQNKEMVSRMARARYSNEAISKWAQILTTQNGCILYLVCGLTSIYLVNNGSLEPAQMGLLLHYSAQLQRSFMDFFMGWTSVEMDLVAMERVAEYIRTEPEPDTVAKNPESNSVLATSPKVGEVVFTNVTFRYRLYRPAVLSNASFRIPPGAKCGLVGRTGSGKSTIVSLLPRLYPCTSGSIFLDGTDINTIPVHELRERIHYVSQEAILIPGTIRDNLLYHYCSSKVEGEVRNNVDDKAIWDVLEIVRMKDKIANLPLKLDQRIGKDMENDGKDGQPSNGIDFSVGERQLLSFARALIHRKRGDMLTPNILIADEPTSNIDLETDKFIHETLFKMENMTMIVILHRLHYLDRFDMVITLDKGEIVDIKHQKKILD